MRAAWVLALVGLASESSLAGDGLDAPSSGTNTAGSRDAAATKDSGAAPGAGSSAAGVGSAEAAYEKAVSCYAAGDLQGALGFMSESYRLSQRPELFYNLASLKRELEQCRAALDDFRRYLELVPRGRYRERALQALEELEQECPSVARTEPRANASVALSERADLPGRSQEYWTPPRVVAWSAMATGVLAGAGAVYFFLAASAARDDVQASVTAQVKGGPPWDQGRQEDQHRNQTLAHVFGVTSGALVAGGALLLVFGPAGERNPSGVAVSVQPGAAGASFSRQF